MLKKAFLFIFILLLLSGALISDAQTYNPFNQRDDEYRLLGLKRAKEAFEMARNEYERQHTLFEKNLITEADLDRAKTVYSDAEVNYQQSLLAVLFEKQYISVISAVKTQSKDNTKKVRLTMANTSGGTEEFRKLLNIDDDLFRSLQPDIIHNVYVSLLNDENAIISQPYEAKLLELRYGHPQTIEFGLLQDVDAVVVSIIYGNGNQRGMKIYLEKDAAFNQVAVQSEQFSQEVELGKNANYDLTLELFSGSSNTFSLEVVNLPKQISFQFKDPTGRIRLRQIKFTESGRTKRAVLQTTLPDRSTGEVVMDEPISFYVLVLPDEKQLEIPNIGEKIWTEDELDELDIGYVKLELVPRGKGELLVRAPQLYHSILPDETVAMNMDILNEGSRRLDQIEITADLPLNWSKHIDPENINSLEIGQEKRVDLSFIPPNDIAVGKYEIRVQTTALTSGQLVTSTDKIVTVEIRARTNVAGTIIIVLFIIGIVGGIIYYGLRLSRK
ncbi:MAG: NEW3 domain-containing protein [Candidatus Zixiibacteriota bacterium]